MVFRIYVFFFSFVDVIGAMAPTDVETNNSSKKPGKGGKPLRQPKVLSNTQQPPPAIRRGVWFSYPAAPSLFVTVTWPRGPQSGAGKRYQGGGPST